MCSTSCNYCKHTHDYIIKLDTKWSDCVNHTNACAVNPFTMNQFIDLIPSMHLYVVMRRQWRTHEWGHTCRLTWIGNPNVVAEASVAVASICTHLHLRICIHFHWVSRCRNYLTPKSSHFIQLPKALRHEMLDERKRPQTPTLRSLHSYVLTRLNDFFFSWVQVSFS